MPFVVEAECVTALRLLVFCVCQKATVCQKSFILPLTLVTLSPDFRPEGL